MDNRISEDFIEEVRQQADIVEIISEHVALKRKGKNYQGLCPFHSEKTPSFSVNPERQMFYCFGCQTGGNIFSFLMKKEHMTFIEALTLVADKVGLALPQQERSLQEKKNEQRQKRYKQIYEWATQYFSDVLFNRPEGREGLIYLKNRGIEEDTIRLFRLGYAPNRWDGLLEEMREKGVYPEELVELGLAVKKDHESDHVSFYDRFRGRVIFTITDSRGFPIAFGGRVLDDSQPKYLNSPETIGFHKGKNLYGIHLAYQFIRENGYALLLEGYMDTIAVHKAGISQAVASLGTALTIEQARILKRYTDKVIICYDNDQAGIQATLKAGEILKNAGLKTEVLVLENAKDPDEYLQKYSAQELLNKLENTVTFIEYKYKMLIKENNPRTIPDKADIIRKIASDIIKTTSAAEREGYERYLSLELGLTLEAVQHEIHSQDKKNKGNKGKHQFFLQKQDINVKKRNTIEEAKIDCPMGTFVPLGVFRAEQIILRLILDNPQLKNRVLDKLEVDFWRLKEHQYIYENFPRKSLDSLVNDDDSWYQKVQQRIAELYELDLDLNQAEDILEDCITSILSERNKETIEELQERMISLERSGDMSGALTLLQEIGERLKRGEN